MRREISTKGKSERGVVFSRQKIAVVFFCFLLLKKTVGISLMIIFSVS
jgi:hypothetical protein